MSCAVIGILGEGWACFSKGRGEKKAAADIGGYWRISGMITRVIGRVCRCIGGIEEG